MEALAKRLEASYTGMMKDWAKMLCKQVGGGGCVLRWRPR